MSARLVPVMLLLLLLAAASVAQEPAGHPTPGQPTGERTAPDVPTGEAAIRGRVVHRTRPEASRDVEVLLYSLSGQGQPGLRVTTSDAEGRFRFEGISESSATIYLVGARFQSVPYPGARVQFGEGERNRDVQVAIADVESRSDHLIVEELRLRLELSGAALRVSETRVLRNPSPRTAYVPAEGRAGLAPLLKLELPAQATDFRVPLGVVPEGLSQQDGRVRFYGPIYPGQQELGFSYALPALGGSVDLSRRLATSVERVVLLTPRDGPSLQLADFGAGEDVELRGMPYRRFEAGARRAGTRLELAMEVPPARTDPDAVSIAEVRIYLDLDAAALRVREEHLLRVEGGSRVMAEAGSALLRIPLPGAQQQLRFGSSAPGLELVAEADGDLGVLGPLPPGESTVEFTYRLPVSQAVTHFARGFARAVPLLSIYLADPGSLLLESDRLHRRRPMRTADGSFFHLEAFEIAPDERVALRIAPAAARRSLPRSAVVGFFSLLALASTALLLAPLREKEALLPGPAEEASTRRDREAIYAAIRDLDHDHETQKIADADYESMRGELRARAVALLRQDTHSAPSASGPKRGGDAEASAQACDATRGACPECAETLRADDRFCSQCGAATPLPEPGPRA